jgi:hypothetical protein
VLDRKDVDSLKAFWSEFRKRDWTSPTWLGVALRRFNYGHLRVELEDALLDFMISFEALLLKEGEAANVHKLAVRSARLLGEKFEDRKKVYREIGEFYSKKSALVHGESLLLTTDVVVKIEEDLRRCIREMLDRFKASSHESILTSLDLE